MMIQQQYEQFHSDSFPYYTSYIYYQYDIDCLTSYDTGHCTDYLQ